MRIQLIRIGGGSWTGSAFCANFRFVRQRPGTTLITPDSITGNLIVADTALISRLQAVSAWIGSAQLAGTIQSDNFSAGNAGWRIRRAGDAEFSSITIRRQMTVASGSFASPSGSVGNDTSMPVFLSGRFETSVNLNAWSGGQGAYVVLMGTGGTINSNGGSETTRIWAVNGMAVPMTRWDGRARIWIYWDARGRNVTFSNLTTINWELIRIT